MKKDLLPKRGRPRSDEARRKVLLAAHDILMNEGFGRLTVEAAATRSGVGKPTIYRSWSNASELAMAALMMAPPVGDESKGETLEDALRSQLVSLVRAFSAKRGRQITLTLAAADPESELTRAFRNQIILRSRESGRQKIDAAVAEHEIAEPADMETILDMIYGPLFYRILVGHQPLTEKFADSLTRLAIKALRAD